MAVVSRVGPVFEWALSYWTRYVMWRLRNDRMVWAACPLSRLTLLMRPLMWPYSTRQVASRQPTTPVCMCHTLDRLTTGPGCCILALNTNLVLFDSLAVAVAIAAAAALG